MFVDIQVLKLGTVPEGVPEGEDVFIHGLLWLSQQLSPCLSLRGGTHVVDLTVCARWQHHAF